MNMQEINPLQQIISLLSRTHEIFDCGFKFGGALFVACSSICNYQRIVEGLKVRFYTLH